jgi:hypothetical protein
MLVRKTEWKRFRRRQEDNIKAYLRTPGLSSASPMEQRKQAINPSPKVFRDMPRWFATGKGWVVAGACSKDGVKPL